MIEIVKENPCTDCGIKGLYSQCEEECVQYKKWYQYHQGRHDAIDECKEVIRQHWLNGTIAFRFVDEIKNNLEKLKEK